MSLAEIMAAKAAELQVAGPIAEGVPAGLTTITTEGEAEPPEPPPIVPEASPVRPLVSKGEALFKSHTSHFGFFGPDNERHVFVSGYLSTADEALADYIRANYIPSHCAEVKA